MSWSCSCCTAALMGPPGRAQAPALCSMRSMSSDVLALLLRSSHSCLGNGCGAHMDSFIGIHAIYLISSAPDTKSV